MYTYTHMHVHTQLYTHTYRHTHMYPLPVHEVIPLITVTQKRKIYKLSKVNFRTYIKSNYLPLRDGEGLYNLSIVH